MQNLLTAPMELSALTKGWERVKAWGWVVPLIIVVTTLWSVWRLFGLINSHATVIPFWDQFDNWRFCQQITNPFALFWLQRGPHRMGLAFLLSDVVLRLSGWNSRAESFTVFALVLIALALALWLVRRLRGRWSVTDTCLPVLFLSPAAWESYTGTPFLAIASLPLVFLLAFCHLILYPPSAKRQALLTLLVVVSIYTGNGIFLLPLSLLVLTWEVFALQGQQRLVALGSGLVILLASAAWLYHYNPALDGSKHPGFAFGLLHPYLDFMATMQAAYLGFGMSDAFLLVGYIALLLLSGVALFNGWRWLRTTERKSAVLLVLALFTLAFSLLTAYGRLQLGPTAPLASRYTLLLVPGFLALYLCAVQGQPTRWQIGWQALFCLLALTWVAPVRDSDLGDMDRYYAWKTRWERTYFQTGRIPVADKRTRSVYPVENYIFLDVMAYLQQHHTGFLAHPDVSR